MALLGPDAVVSFHDARTRGVALTTAPLNQVVVGPAVSVVG